MRVLILGATSHIALNLIKGFSLDEKIQLDLFARAPGRVVSFLKNLPKGGGTIRCFDIDSLASFNEPLDAIVNCVGFGTPERISLAGREIFFVTERFDNAAMEIAEKNNECVYVDFSSGAVYGRDRREPIEAYAEARFKLDALGPADAYAVAKLNSEAKHRASPSLSIIDLRVFGFFSRYIDLSSRYLVAEMTRAARDRLPFITDARDFIRDYVAPGDLCSLVRSCISAKGINTGLDVYSRAPVTKTGLITEFTERFGLQVKYVDATEHTSTGVKDQYFTKNHSAEVILGYKPNHTAVEAVIEEVEAILNV